ncbi:MAG: hypothetical protein JWM54_401 [Acidobacteriaceae bacterium]|nr:hypothetical protein [Acidobacteriaceae bacterium]
MAAAAAQMYQLAHSQAARMRAMLEDVADRFNATFALTGEEVATLEVHPELHASGAAIELSLADQGIVFSLAPLLQPGTASVGWELVAYHGDQMAPERVCMLRLRATKDGQVRRLRGARLVIAIGDYLESQLTQRDTQETMVGVLTHLRNETTPAAWLPQIAASHRVYHA